MPPDDHDVSAVPARWWQRPVRVPAIVQWVLLASIAVALLQWVEPTVINSPYNGF